MSTAEQTLIIVPTYQEAGNIGRLISAIFASVPVSRILVVDDNSPDGTAAVVSRIAASDSRVGLLTRAGKLGLGSAYLAGFQMALTLPVRHVITMDADFSHPPDALRDMLEQAEQPDVDIVIGSRYVAGGRTEGTSRARKLLSHGANSLARATLGLSPADCTGGFRCYRRSVLEALSQQVIVSKGYSALVELLWRAEQAGFVVREIPIVFRDRRVGISKITAGEVWGGLKTLFRLRARASSGPGIIPLVQELEPAAIAAQAASAGPGESV